MKLQGIIQGETRWWSGDYWVKTPAQAKEMTRKEIERQIRIANSNNRFLDREDRVESLQEVN